MAALREKQVVVPLKLFAAARAFPVVPLECNHRTIHQYVGQTDNDHDMLIPTEESEEATKQQTKNKPTWEEKPKLDPQSPASSPGRPVSGYYFFSGLRPEMRSNGHGTSFKDWLLRVS